MAGSGPFTDEVRLEIEGTPGDHLSVATMLARTNDLFTGVNDPALPSEGSVIIDETLVYDAGTEENTGLVEHIPFYGNTFVGPDEVAPIGIISQYMVNNDPDHGTLAYEFPPTARITVTVVDPIPVEIRGWGELKAKYR